MIEKLRSRHPIDLPAERWRFNWILFLILGGIAGLFLFLPLGLAFAGPVGLALLERDLALPIAIVLAGGTFVSALVAGAVLGKPGHRRH